MYIVTCIHALYYVSRERLGREDERARERDNE